MPVRIEFSGPTLTDVLGQMEQFQAGVGVVDLSATVAPVSIVAPVAPVVPVVEQEEVPATTDANGFDKAGFPWDERIHAATKTQNKDGTWRYKRYTDEATIKSVEAELSARINGTPVVQQAPVVPVVEQAPVLPTAAAATPSPVVPTPTVAVGNVTPATIVAFINEKKLDVPTQVMPVLNAHGLDALPKMFMPDAAPLLASIFASLGGGQ